MKNNTIVVKLDKKVVEYVEKLWMEYNSKKDIITSMFEQHKFDIDSIVISSIPFKYYEKEFEKSKAEYEMAMSEIEISHIPSNLRGNGTRFEINFDECDLTIFPSGEID